MREAIEKGGRFQMMAYGTSMLPFVKNGTRLIIEPFNQNSPRIGDVVAFERLESKELVIHRIVGKRTKGYLIKGDNSKMIETCNFPGSIIGKIADKESDLFFGIFFRQTTAFIIAVLSRGRIIEFGWKIGKIIKQYMNNMA